MNFRKFSKLTIILLIVLSGIFFASFVKIHEDAMDMLPDEAARSDFHILQQLGLINRIIISIELAGPPEDDDFTVLSETMDSFGNKLRANPLFNQVTWRLDKDYQTRTAQQFWKSLPALFTPADLERIRVKLSPAGLDDAMRKNMELLAGPAGIGLQKQVQRDPLGLLPDFLQRLQSCQGEFHLVIRDGYLISWDGRHGLVLAQSSVPLTDSAAAAKVQAALSSIQAEIIPPDTRARIIGALPHTLANNRIIRHDLQVLLPFDLLLLFGFLVLFLSAWQSVMVMTVPFLGAPLAVSLVAAIEGKVSAMAMGFGMALLGIGVDYAIHIYVHCGAGGKVRQIRRPVTLAALTTIGIFFIMLFSRVAMHQQMALLAITGLTGAVLLSWWLVPDLAALGSKNQNKSISHSWLPTNSGRKRWLKIGTWLIILAGGAWAWSRLHYNGDLRLMDCKDQQIREDEELFREAWGQRPAQAFVVTTGADLTQVLDTNDRIYHFLQNNGASGIQSLSMIMQGPEIQRGNLARWQELWRNKHETIQSLDIAGQRAGFVAGAFTPFADWLSSPPKMLAAEELMTGPLRPIFDSMLKDVVIDGNHSYMLTTMVEDKDTNRPVLTALADQESTVRVVSPAMWRERVEQLLRHDAVYMGGTALLWVGGLILVFFRSLKTTLAVLAPVLAALAGMAIVALAMGGELNPTQVIMGVMIIGLTEDYGVFIAYSRMMEDKHNTVLAVSACAVSTLSGFGVLSLASHPVLQGLGVIVLAGILFSWPTAIFVTPALMGSR